MILGKAKIDNKVQRGKEKKWHETYAIPAAMPGAARPPVRAKSAPAATPAEPILSPRITCPLVMRGPVRFATVTSVLFGGAEVAWGRCCR